MSKVNYFILVILLSVAIPFNCYCQVTLYPTASATIVTPIGVTKNYNLDFGNLGVVTTSGNCILSPVGGTNPTRTISGGVTLPAFQGTPRAAEFTVTGVPAQQFTITIPPSNLIITSGNFSMVVNSFTTDQAIISPGTTWSGTFGANGTTFHIGATVHVSANQPPGLYQNLAGFPVIVNYQ